MRTFRQFTASLLLMAGLASQAMAEDIDIFTGGSSNNADNPNVLIVIDNSSNWSAANQNWPKDPACTVDANTCDKQGYYELKALRSVLSSLTDPNTTLPINIGLMMFNNSNATRDGGYVRTHLRMMTPSDRQAMIDTIDKIIANFNTETAASSVQYGAMLFDVFKYFGGFTNPDNATTDQAPTTIPTYSGVPVFGTPFWGSNDKDSIDLTAYNGSNYKSPSITSCGRNYLVFIGNGFPAKDDVTSSNMYEVLQKLTNPDNPAQPIEQFPLETITTSESCAAVTGGTGAICSNQDNCTAKLPNYTNTEDTTHSCKITPGCSGNTKYKVNACTVTSTSSFGPPIGNAIGRYADEYANFLYKTDVSPVDGQQRVITYAIDVFRDQPDANQTQLMRNMANYGGGKYFAASNEDAIINAFKQIISEIQAVNTTFASASLPVNATNRAQNENQVFIGMFRPDADSKPRWFGNLKRFQLGIFGSRVDLADVNGAEAVNPNTGFVTECATSFWTTDSGNYFENILLNPSPASRCLSSTLNKFSDAPDGPFVEKGAVAEVLRKGNNPPLTNLEPTWAVNRNLFTVAGNALTAYTTSSSGLNTTDTSFVTGEDTQNDNPDREGDTRPSIHGDVVHSRPIPINYGSSVTVYYGANDGTYRAVDADTGREKWALVAPEFEASAFSRLRRQEPLIKYPNSLVENAEPKDYFWDGSTGIFQNLDNSKVWIFPTMRRGGRMVYGLDVTDSASPDLMWRAGCPNLSNDADCSPGFGNIGQTWSTPSVALIKGYDLEKPVIIMGGGYDRCEDENTATPGCSATKGNSIYILDAETGSVLRTFSTTRGVAADISLVDVNYDGYVDYAYGADLGGNIWRISFVNTDNSARDIGGWTNTLAAFTNDGNRKFFYGPAVLPYKGGIYLALGSGDREHPLEDQYPYSSVTNRFYVYLDDPNRTTAEAINLDSTDSMKDFTADTDNNTDKLLPGAGFAGWFMNLSQYGAGEQTVTSAMIIGGLVTFSTNRPVPASNTCATSLGEARGYWVNLLNACGTIGTEGVTCGGDRSTLFVGGGLPPSPVVGTVSINGEPVTVVIGAVDKEGGVSSPIGGQEAPGIGSSARKRTYWRIKGD